jgi:serine/threonine-protein kinase
MPTEAHTSEPRAKLLFVDDEQRVLNSMRVMFRRNFELFFASRGAEALEIIDREDIDVIVADHRMPQMTGVQVLASAKTISPRTVRILLTGYADLDAVEGSINDGEVFRFLTKPCAPTELRATVELAAKVSRREPTSARVSVPEPSDSRIGAVESQAMPDDPGRHSAASADGRTGDANLDDDWTRTMTEHELIATTVIERPPEPQTIDDTAAATPSGAGSGGVVVFTDDKNIIDTVHEATQDRLPIHVASNIVQVVKMLGEHKPGVLITDISADRNTIQSMTANLKRHLPELVTIVISPHRDVLDMVWLINHGQIFRFLRKPVSPGRCGVSIQAALQHHQALLDDPALVERHAVDHAAEGGMLGGMLDTIRAVRRLWA